MDEFSRQKKNEINTSYYQRNRKRLAEKQRLLYQENKERINERRRERHAADPGKIRGYAREYYLKNRESFIKRMRKYSKENASQRRIKEKEQYRLDPDRKKKQVYAWRAKNTEKVSRSNKVWRKKNPDKVHFIQKRNHDRRYASDPNYKIAFCLRRRLVIALKKGYKAGSAVRDLGCSISELRTRLESLFLPGMSWENHGRSGWHIDHITPLAAFDLTDPEQLKIACHYTNLQPLWAADNIKKGAKK